MGGVERYEEPSDDVLAYFGAQGVVLDQEQRYQIAKLEVIEGTDGLIQLWGALSGGVEERIQGMSAVQERRALEGWRLETDYKADREAEARADEARRKRGKEREAEIKKEQETAKAKVQAAQEKRWMAFEQAKGRLMQQWGLGAWTTLERDLRSVAWSETGVRLSVSQTTTATSKKAVFLSAAMREILSQADWS